MPKLNDTQTILLSTASQREDLRLHPLPEAQAKGGARVTKAIATLIKAGLLEEQGEGAIFATIAGMAAIGIEPEEEQADGPTVEPEPLQPRATKSALLIDLLKREGGATLPDLIAATGWLPHTTRAALTGLRKKGHAIERFKQDEVTTYRITG
jgi:hypothetical protein